jgi:ABC-type uncharacterized transport system YnjBCD ATPase subunit
VRVLIFAQSAERRVTLRRMLSKEPDISLVDIPATDLNTTLRGVRQGVVVVDVDSDLEIKPETLSESQAPVVLLADDPDVAWIAQLLASRPVQY